MTMVEESMIANAIPAQGPEGLMQVFDHLLEKARANPSSPKEFVVLYQLGQQRSIIKIDFNQTPCHFWYHDLLGRPMTKAVEHTIAEFLWTRCGEKERYTKDVSS